MTGDSGTGLGHNGARTGGSLHWAALAALCLLPAFQTAVAVYLEFYPWITYPLLKCAIIAAPLLAWMGLRRTRRQVLRDIGLKRTRCVGGLVTGLVFAAGILGAYYALFRGVDASAIIAKAQRFRVRTPVGFWGMAMFISFSNSLVEEYYWRGFILDQLRVRFDNVLGVSLLAGGLFGLHHVFVFAPLLGLQMAVLCTLGTAVAGVVWSWQRLKGWSLLDCYVGHILADLAGLWAAWDVIGIGS